MKTLCCTYVRPHLEFAVQAWSPFLMKGINELENVLRRATKMIPELRHLDYEERLKTIKLTTLEGTRLDFVIDNKDIPRPNRTRPNFQIKNKN